MGNTGNTQIVPEFFVCVCSRNPIAVWAVENILIPRSSGWRIDTWLPKQLLVVEQGTHILIIDISSVCEWPETVRKWTVAGHRTLVIVAEGWNSGGADLRALHLGVRGIVTLSPNFEKQLLEAIDVVAKGHLFA